MPTTRQSPLEEARSLESRAKKLFQSPFSYSPGAPPAREQLRDAERQIAALARLEKRIEALLFEAREGEPEVEKLIAGILERVRSACDTLVDWRDGFICTDGDCC